LFQFFSDNFSTVFWNAQAKLFVQDKEKSTEKKVFNFLCIAETKKNEGKIFFSTIFRRRLFLILIKQKFVI